MLARNTDSSTVQVPQQRQTVLWIIAILLAVIATTMLSKRDGSFALPSAFADDPSMVGGKGIYAFTGPLDKNRNGLWMMDVDNHTIWCYEYLPATRKLKLVAARSFDYDRYLTDHENDEPTAQQVRELVERQHQIKNRIQKKASAVDGFGDKGGSRNGPHSKDSTKAPHKAAPEEEDSLGTSVPGIYEPETTQDDDN